MTALCASIHLIKTEPLHYHPHFELDRFAGAIHIHLKPMHLPHSLQSLIVLTATFASLTSLGQPAPAVNVVPVGDGFAKTSVNTVIFRTNSLVTHGDTQ